MLPYQRARISTSHTEKKLLERLGKEIEPIKALRIKSNHRYFQGNIKGNSFRIHRVVAHWNSLLPVIEGSVRKKSILLLFRPHRLVSGVYLCLFGFTTVASFLAGRDSVPIILSFLSLSLLAIYVFYAEANEQMKHIRKIISG
jgi:hypothetical protein